MVTVYRDEGLIDISYINKFEEVVGYKFPSSYKHLLSEHNCLSPEESDFNFFDITENQGSSRNVTFYGYGDKIKSYEKISRFQQDEHCHNHIVVIGGTAGGDYVCFDYRINPKTDKPSVVMMYHDYADDDKMLICSVSENFEQFMNSLYKSDE